MLGLASRLRKKLRPVDIQVRIDEISKQFTGAGWKNLPQELVDEILGHLLDNMRALKACSLTCRCLFGAVRPLIHQQLACLGSRPGRLKPKRSLFGPRKRHPGAFKQLLDADRLGILHYTRRLTLKSKHLHYYPRFNAGDMQEYLPHFGRSPSYRVSLSKHFIFPRLSRFSMNISACSSTLYDASTYEIPGARYRSFCISFASFHCLKT